MNSDRSSRSDPGRVVGAEGQAGRPGRLRGRIAGLDQADLAGQGHAVGVAPRVGQGRPSARQADRRPAGGVGHQGVEVRQGAREPALEPQRRQALAQARDADPVGDENGGFARQRVEGQLAGRQVEAPPSGQGDGGPSRAVGRALEAGQQLVQGQGLASGRPIASQVDHGQPGPAAVGDRHAGGPIDPRPAVARHQGDPGSRRAGDDQQPQLGPAGREAGRRGWAGRGQLEAGRVAADRPGAGAVDPEALDLRRQVVREGEGRSGRADLVGARQVEPAGQLEGAEVDPLAELLAEAGEVDGRGQGDPLVEPPPRGAVEERGVDRQPFDGRLARLADDPGVEGGGVLEREGLVVVAGGEVGDLRLDVEGRPIALGGEVDDDPRRAAIHAQAVAEAEGMGELAGDLGQVDRPFDPLLPSAARPDELAFRLELAERAVGREPADLPALVPLGQVPARLAAVERERVARQRRALGLQPVDPGVAGEDPAAPLAGEVERAVELAGDVHPPFPRHERPAPGDHADLDLGRSRRPPLRRPGVELPLRLQAGVAVGELHLPGQRRGGLRQPQGQVDGLGRGGLGEDRVDVADRSVDDSDGEVAIGVGVVDEGPEGVDEVDLSVFGPRDLDRRPVDDEHGGALVAQNQPAQRLVEDDRGGLEDRVALRVEQGQPGEPSRAGPGEMQGLEPDLAGRQGPVERGVDPRAERAAGDQPGERGDQGQGRDEGDPRGLPPASTSTGRARVAHRSIAPLDAERLRGPPRPMIAARGSGR